MFVCVGHEAFQMCVGGGGRVVVAVQQVHQSRSPGSRNLLLLLIPYAHTQHAFSRLLHLKDSA